MHIDYHCHTTASDGSLTPEKLIALAVEQGVESLSITDHDTLLAYENLEDIPENLNLVPGVEFSTLWQKTGIHVLGLNVDPNNSAIHEAVDYQTHAREIRAHQIAEKLKRYGLDEAYEGAREIANSIAPGRPHFARYMVKSGFVKNEREAFKKFLGSGKTCDVKHTWASLEKIIEWIRAADGVAVLAHPGHYRLTRTKLVQLLNDFTHFGGEGIEVVSGRQQPNLTKNLAGLCDLFKLWASWGSDFHHPGQQWAMLGRYTSPPPGIKPIWEKWC